MDYCFSDEFKIQLIGTQVLSKLGVLWRSCSFSDDFETADETAWYKSVHGIRKVRRCPIATFLQGQTRMADSYHTRVFQGSFLGTETDDNSMLDPEIETYENLGNRMAHQVERHKIQQTSLLARILTLPEENICDISLWQTSTNGSLGYPSSRGLSGYAVRKLPSRALSIRTISIPVTIP
jgi:hypothetical protein